MQFKKRLVTFSLYCFVAGKQNFVSLEEEEILLN
jgi:hypothetical protein